MAIPQLVGTNSAAQTSTSSSITVNYPTASKSGDLIIASVEFYRTVAAAYTLNTPAGWTLVESSNQSSGVGRYFGVFYAFRGAETSVTISISIGTLGTMLATAQTHAYKGDIDQTTPIDAHASTYSATAASAHTLPSVTTTQSDFAMVGLFHGHRAASATAATNTWTSQMWECIDTGSALNSLYHCVSGAAEYGLYGSGATGTRTVTTDASVTTSNNFMCTLAIKSPQTGPTVRGTNTTVNGGTASATLASSYPSGDFFICCTEFRKSSPSAFTVSVSDPTNWTLIASEDHSASDGTRLDVWAGWRAGGATSVTMTASTSTGMFGMANIVAIPNDGHAIDVTEPYGDVQIVYGNTSATTITIPSSTTTVPMSLSHLVAMSWMATAQTAFTHSWAQPPYEAPGYTAEQTIGCATIGRQMGHSTCIDYQEVAGSTGTEVVTMTQTCNPRYGVRVIIQPPHANLKPGSDTGSGSDAASLVAQSPAADTGSGADLAGNLLISGTGTADAAAASDTAKVIVVATGDTALETDNAATTAQAPGADTAAGVDAASITVVVTGADTAAGADTATILVAAPTDSATGVENAVPFAFDAGSGTDTATKITVTDTDSVAGLDSAFVSQAVIQNDSVAGTDTAAVVVVATGDAGTGTEFAVPFATDTALGTDTGKVVATATDAGAGTESAFVSNAVAVNDTYVGSDTAIVVVNPTGDTGTGVETSHGFGSDTGTGTETANVISTGADSVAAVDDAKSTNLASSADSGTASDTTKVVFNVADTAAAPGADAATLNATALGTDTGLGSESATVIVRATGETGTGVDTSKVIMAVADTGTSVDNGAIAVFVFGFDTGGGADTALVGVPSGDSGLSSEATSKTVNGFLDAPRMTIVVPESRITSVPYESRGIAVDGEVRLVMIGLESIRTIKVDPEVRTVTIYPEK